MRPSFATVDEVQMYLHAGLIILPFVYEQFLKDVKHLEQTNKVCLLPTTVLEIYHTRFRNLFGRVPARTLVKREEQM